jgi:hypothetical protein
LCVSMAVTKANYYLPPNYVTELWTVCFAHITTLSFSPFGFYLLSIRYFRIIHMLINNNKNAHL